MRSLFILVLLILLTFTSATSHDTSFSYPNLHVTDASQHSLFAIFKDPSLIQDDTKNLTSIFNLTCTMATHIPQAQEELQKGSGPFTFWLPDDQGLFQAKPWWEKQIQQDNNFTDVDLGKTWNGTETNETIKKVVMNYTHAGLMWSGMKGNITLSSLQEENLLTTCLNDTQFVALGKNETTGNNAYQMMRVVKGDSLSIYGKNMTMDHSNRTNVMVVSGSGMKEWQIAHVYRAIIAKNGVVYILDRAVSFPQNTTKMLKKENATLFLKGIDKADLNSTINNTPNVTIFVPTDEAIERVMREYGVPDETKRKYTKENMRDILKPYIIKGAFYAQDFNSSTPPTLESMSGQIHPVSRGPSGEVLLYGNVSVIAPNILTRNGVVHMINDTFRELEQEIVKKLPKTQARRFRRFF